MARAGTRKLYDAFPSRSGAMRLARDLNFQMRDRPSYNCPDARVRKLKKPQDGGRLKYGVYVAKSCRTLWGGR